MNNLGEEDGIWPSCLSHIPCLGLFDPPWPCQSQVAMTIGHSSSHVVVAYGDNFQNPLNQPQKCVSITRQHGLSRRRKKDGAARQWGGKQKYKSKKNRRQNNEEPTRQRGEAEWKIGRCTTGWWKTQGAAALTTERVEQKENTKGTEDKLSRGQRGAQNDGGGPKKCQTSFF